MSKNSKFPLLKIQLVKKTIDEPKKKDIMVEQEIKEEIMKLRPKKYEMATIRGFKYFK